jgi:SAM-dependent methyltransferase
MMLSRIATRLISIAREKGARGAISKIATRLARPRHSPKADDFDLTHGTDTAASVPLWRLNIPSENARFGVQYQMTDPGFFAKAVASVPADPRKLTFIDIGCGKGRTLMMANERQFKRIVGVEFAPQLAEIARQNLLKVGVRAEVVERDAAEFEFPDEDLFLYMFNPFSEPVLRKVVQNLAQWRTRSERLAFVVYANPQFDFVFESRQEFTLTAQSEHASIWRV